jgi:hypothetical protein
MTKKQDPNPDPDPLVRGMDPRIRIHSKMSWIRNTDFRNSDPDQRPKVKSRKLWGVYNNGAMEADNGIVEAQNWSRTWPIG